MVNLDRLEYRLAELERKLANVIRIGVITEANYVDAKVRVQLGEITTGWLPWLTRRAGNDIEWWAPEVGEQVMVLSSQGEIGQGVVLPALYSKAYSETVAKETVHQVTFFDGAKFYYDREAMKLSIELPGSGTASLIAKGGVSIEGDVAVTGNVTASGDVIDKAGALSRLRDNYNAHTHIGNLGSATSMADAQDPAS